MEFSGFINKDFDFFRKKLTMEKPEFDERKEEVKRHFREYCYEIQKIYHNTEGGTLSLEKNFLGLSKNKNSIYAVSNNNCVEYLSLKIEFGQDSIITGFACPPDGDYKKFEHFKLALQSKRDVFTRFFKENKSMGIVLYNRISKKSGDDVWQEAFKFSNNELSMGDYDILINNMEKLQPSEYNSKKLAGMYLGVQYSKADAVKIGKMLAQRSCTEIIKLLNLSSNII